MLWTLLALQGCDRREPYTGPPVDASSISGYHGLDGAGSWIYRDDATDTDPEEDQLLHAQEDGGLVELRRGARWADAIPTGSMEWDTSDGLDLIAWDLPSGASGDTPLRLSEEDITQPGDSCVVTVPEEGHPTYYGTYEDVLIYDCDGGLPGRYVFALNVGLVWMETSTDTLDLVAPW